jgi:hypothetical protein
MSIMQLEKRLAVAGYTVHNLNPSRTNSMEEIVARIHGQFVERSHQIRRGNYRGRPGINPLDRFGLITPGEGRNSVEKTLVARRKDHLVVPLEHTFFMDATRVSHQII